MAKRGPKPKPSALDKVDGNPGRRKRPAEPEPEPASLAPPEHITGLAREAWEKFAPMLGRLGILTEADTTALELLCTTYEHWRQAEAEIREARSLVQVTESGYEQLSGWVTAAAKFHDQLKKLLAEFGMTPASRASVQRIDGGADPADEFLSWAAA